MSRKIARSESSATSNEMYKVGRGEQGALFAEPYTSELQAIWKFRTTELAHESAKAIFKKFQEYKRQGDFVGQDVARKFLSMGCTRAKRYATKTGEEICSIFKRYLDRVEKDADYIRKRADWRVAYG